MINNSDLFKIPKNKIETRWASPENWTAEKGAGGQLNNGRKGCASFALEAGASRVLAEYQGGAGIVRRIWITIFDRSPEMLRGIKLEMFWDNCEKPAVSAPIGDFFGHGLGRMSTFQSALFTSPEGRSFNAYIDMPFRKAMKIVVTNEATKTQPMFFYDVNFTIGDQLDENVGYFHAFFHRQNPTKMKQDFELLPKINGKGRFLGTNISVIANQKIYWSSWWGEGEVKMYIDGDQKFPTLNGTGTEDYIGTGWAQGLYSHLYQGCTIADKPNMNYCFYRYHIADPVYFYEDIRVTMQQLGTWDPEVRPTMHFLGTPIYKGGNDEIADLSINGDPQSNGLFEREDDWSCCSYFYLDKPSTTLPKIQAAEERYSGLNII